MSDHCQHIVQLAATLVVHALRCADAAKIEPHCRPPALGKRAGERLHDLVVQRAAEQRVRVSDDGKSFGGHPPCGGVNYDFNRARRAFKS